MKNEKNEVNYMTIGENIKKARKRAGLTQSQLGEKLHVSNIMIALYETGKRNPKEETLQKFAEALNTTVYELRGIDFWVPCSERLPEKSGQYLISYEGFKFLQVVDYSTKYKKFNVVDTQSKEDAEKFAFKDVIAWMPLPEPYNPKKEENDG